MFGREDKLKVLRDNKGLNFGRVKKTFFTAYPETGMDKRNGVYYGTARILDFDTNEVLEERTFNGTREKVIQEAAKFYESRMGKYRRD